MTGLLERSAPAEVLAGVRLREARPGDAAAVRAFLAGLTPDSAYRRFFTGIGPSPRPRWSTG